MLELNDPNTGDSSSRDVLGAQSASKYSVTNGPPDSIGGPLGDSCYNASLTYAVESRNPTTNIIHRPLPSSRTHVARTQTREDDGSLYEEGFPGAGASP